MMTNKVTNTISVDAEVFINRMQRLFKKQHVSLEFKECCRSYSVFRPCFRPGGPDQRFPFSSLVSVQNCNILLLLER